MKPWMYVLAAVFGSLAGAILDAVLYSDGGSFFMKIGVVAGPGLLFAVAKLRGSPSDAGEGE